MEDAKDDGSGIGEVDQAVRSDEDLTNRRVCALGNDPATIWKLRQGLGGLEKASDETCGVPGESPWRRTRQLRRGLDALPDSTLPGGPEDPFLSHFLGDLLVGKGASGVDIIEAAVDCLQDIQMIECRSNSNSTTTPTTR